MALHNDRPRLPRGDFVSGAPIVNAKQKSRPWAAHDPDAPATGEFKLRLNDYQRELLKALAKREFGSQHAAVMRVLVPAMEAALGVDKGE